MVKDPTGDERHLLRCARGSIQYVGNSRQGRVLFHRPPAFDAHFPDSRKLRYRRRVSKKIYRRRFVQRIHSGRKRECRFERSRSTQENRKFGRLRQTVPYQVGSRLPERINFQRSARTIRRGTIRRNYGANHFRTSYHENDGFSGLFPHCTGFHQCSPQRARCLGRSGTWFSRRFGCRLLFENYADRPSEIRFAIRTLP